MSKIDWTLYLVADVGYSPDRDLISTTREAVHAGVSIVQLRAKDMESLPFLETAFRLSKILRPRGIPLIINDRIDIAQASGAEGVHLGQSDIPLKMAREILGPDAIIGVSTNTVGQALAAQAGGADYIGASPVFWTASKPDLDPEIGLDGLRALRKAVTLPIVAIGGIHAGNARDVMGAGADGVAVISAILGAEDPAAAARDLRESIQSRS